MFVLWSHSLPSTLYYICIVRPLVILWKIISKTIWSMLLSFHQIVCNFARQPDKIFLRQIPFRLTLGFVLWDLFCGCRSFLYSHIHILLYPTYFRCSSMTIVKVDGDVFKFVVNVLVVSFFLGRVKDLKCN